MRIRRSVGPLVSGTTYRRGVHLLLGAVLLLPYVLVGAAFAQLLTSPQVPLPLALLVLAVALVIASVPPFLRGTRALEIVAARSLLGVPLPDPPATTEPVREARDTRLRAALWFTLHLAIGGLVAVLLLIPLTTAVLFIGQRLGIGGESLAGLRIGPLDEHDSGWLALLGAAMIVCVGYAVAGLGALAAIMAPVLLGPSPAERIAALEAHAVRLAERNRLARELHDSIGHALTVTTVQAAAAREVLDEDPEFTRRALAAIEDTGRAAAEDLDRLLGMLRDGEAAQRAPLHRLADLDRLVAHSRGTGVEVRTSVEGPLDGLPATVSREGYRIVQESLTNALRHAGRVPVVVRITVGDRLLVIDVANPLTGAERPRQGGRGLDGMRERVRLLGGAMTAGPEEERWRVTVRLPTGERP
ncbi:sensor histidine kinase [Planotetraspora kaengkrachanensis]|uniref:histidine kinase n=1 Tax=Planotetraspora kaengkrachanensis TaxID=575193 RepID=A0A8J3PXC5_9ACTN|nr:histidine kinase [Planotetraspora kaengkrachanensis]GIG82876.1 histidine kinase [Planotetraspora kaengkrachanensis]